MRVLLDACVPRKLKYELAMHNVWTARERGWNRLPDGLLLDAIAGQARGGAAGDAGAHRHQHRSAAAGGAAADRRRQRGGRTGQARPSARCRREGDRRVRADGGRTAPSGSAQRARPCRAGARNGRGQGGGLFPARDPPRPVRCRDLERLRGGRAGCGPHWRGQGCRSTPTEPHSPSPNASPRPTPEMPDGSATSPSATGASPWRWHARAPAAKRYARSRRAAPSSCAAPALAGQRNLAEGPGLVRVPACRAREVGVRPCGSDPMAGPHGRPRARRLPRDRAGWSLAQELRTEWQGVPRGQTRRATGFTQVTQRPTKPLKRFKKCKATTTSTSCSKSLN